MNQSATRTAYPNTTRSTAYGNTAANVWAMGTGGGMEIMYMK
jgi:hypothetical protein